MKFDDYEEYMLSQSTKPKQKYKSQRSDAMGCLSWIWIIIVINGIMKIIEMLY